MPRVLAQVVKWEFGFGPSPVFSLTGLVFRNRRFGETCCWKRHQHRCNGFKALNYLEVEIIN